MKNTDKGLTVPKWVLINRPKVPTMPQNLSAQAQKFGISMKKKASLGVRSPCFKTMQSQHSQPVTMSTSLRLKSFGFLENEVHTCILHIIYFCYR